MNKNKFYKKLTSGIFYFSILLFIIAFNFSDNGSVGWTQQFVNNLNGASIRDITFTDSLNGYIVTSNGGSNSYILKTTNGGDGWDLKFTHNQPFVKVQFINTSTGFTNAFTKIFKTTNNGENWNIINLPQIFGDDMYVLNEDTLWLAMSEGLTGGVFRTTNGGSNWTQQVNLGGNNPTNIYMYNKDTGFVAGTTLYKTTNSGINWLQVPGGGFGEMHFINSTTGWKCYGPMQKTTDGGLNWENIPLPPKSDSLPFSRIINFSNINSDTIWGVGSVGVFGSVARGLIYLTTNGGATWSFQLPDTSINIFRYFYSQFLNKNIGWSYGVATGVHTVTGGDTTITNIINPILEIPENFKLFQNYPNPFNPETNISYQLSFTGYIMIKVYNALGNEIQTIVNQKQIAGSYNILFDGNNVSSGIYFYSLFADGLRIDTKKMVLVR